MKRISALAALAGAGALLAGCAIPGTIELSQPRSAAAARQGGTITVGITAPSGLDPLEAYEPESQLIVRTMCDTLVSLDPKTGDALPGLASTFTPSGSGDTITFKLRSGLRFNDGTKVSVKDATFSLSRLANASNASPEADLLTEIAGSKKLSAALLPDGSQGTLTGVVTLDDHNFQTNLSIKDGGFVKALAEPATAIVSQAAVNRSALGFAQNPVCVGPYKLAAPYSAGDTLIRLVRDPYYNDKAVGYTSGSPFASEIDFKVFPSAALAYAAYGSGGVDVVAVPPGTAAAGSDTFNGNGSALELLGLPDGSDGLFSFAGVRQALSEALDRTSLVTAVWGAGRVPAGGYFPPSLGAVSSATGCGNLAPLTGDAALARATFAKELPALKAQGVNLAAPVPLYVNSDYAYVAEADNVAAQWHSVLGLNVVVTPMVYSDFLAKGLVGFDSAFRLSWSAMSTSPTVMHDDPQSYLFGLFGGFNTSQGNLAHYSGDALGYDYRKTVLPTTDPASRVLEFKSTEKLLCTEMPDIPLAFTTSAWKIRSSLASAASSVLTTQGLPELRELYRTGQG